MCVDNDEIDSDSNASIELSKKSRSMDVTVNFNLNLNDLEKLKETIGKYQCSYYLWKPYNNLTENINESKIIVPIKRYASFISNDYNLGNF